MDIEVLSATYQYAALLRQELSGRNISYAALHQLPHVTSYGHPPAVVYQFSGCGRTHGNFISASYKAILSNWRSTHPCLPPSSPTSPAHIQTGHKAPF